MIKEKNIICLNKHSLKAQKEPYLKHFNVIDDKLNTLLIKTKKGLTKLNFSYYLDEDIAIEIFEDLITQAFEFANTSEDQVDNTKMGIFKDKVLLHYHNYISYIDTLEKQNNFDLLAYIVANLAKQHILINGNKRVIFAFMVLFLQNLCGLYLSTQKMINNILK
ncbi:Fic family protein [Mycoplasmopsis citelli]|uniref:Fic family protein n=1 Tax=Mycoplasmopsis citelli TaxID=171281 RepID=UPI0021142747|nr:Fic family protein [Mycoplasmopsis citelli]UUD36150.1 Fic family protein [Mycoplasmopsis citelli]